nr:exo-alpha-sialidase [Bacteroidota bacterium]
MKKIYLIIVSSIIFTYSGFAQNYALSFDGINDYVDFGNHSIHDPGNNSFTVEFWIYEKESSNYEYSVSKGSISSTQGGWAITYKSGVLRYRAHDGTTHEELQLNILTNQWYHVAMVIDKEQGKLIAYLDGIPSEKDISLGTISINKRLLFGTADVNGAAHFKGEIDEVRLWDHARSQEELIDYMGTVLSGNETGLLGYWNMDDQATTVTDLSPNNKKGTIYGAQYVTNTNSYFTDMEFQNVTCTQDKMHLTAPGNVDTYILRVEVDVEGGQKAFNLTSINLNMNGTTDISDVSQLNAYYTHTSPNFSTLELFATASSSSETIILDGEQLLQNGTNYFWITYDISENATVDNAIDAECLAITIDGPQAGEKIPIVSAPSKSSSIVYQHTDLFVRGEDGVNTFRIPALITTNEGTLIAACDARIAHGGDLPNKINLVIKRSVDKGDTWGNMQTVIDYPGANEGVCDPQLLFDPTTNTVWCFVTYGNGIGLWQSQPGVLEDHTLRIQAVKSTDDGLTWSEPIELNTMIKDPAWHAVVASPGRGTILSNGKMIVPGYYRVGDILHSYLMFSIDHGETWDYTLGPSSSYTISENMVVELNDGTIMTSMRNHAGLAKRAFATSEDEGETWSSIWHSNEIIDPTCQASFLR